MSPPPFCIDPKEIDPGFGLPKTEEEWTYPLSLEYLSDPEPSESDSSSSSRASSATPSDSDVENVPIPIPPAPPSPKKKPTLHLARKKKLTSTVGGWGTKLLRCASCGTMVQERQMQRHVLHKHPKPGQSVPEAMQTCKRCDQVFSRVDAMQRHKRKCTAGRR